MSIGSYDRFFAIEICAARRMIFAFGSPAQRKNAAKEYERKGLFSLRARSPCLLLPACNRAARYGRPYYIQRSERLTDSMATEPPRTASMRERKYFL